MRGRLLAIAAVAVFGAGAVPAHAASPCDTEDAFEESLCRADRPLVSIEMVASPRAGSRISLDAFSPGRRVTYAWDLDGDGAFDDATGAKAEQFFKAGQRTIAVRATDQFGRTSVESRSFLVHTFNTYPTIDLDVGSGTVAVGEPLTVTTTAEDVDGSIRRMELDLDGDGTYNYGVWDTYDEREVTFDTPGTHMINVWTVDDAGDPAWASAPVQVVKPNPGVRLSVAGTPVLAGTPTTVSARALGFSATRYEFDLDGDGTYETDRGTQSSAPATFAAGDREVGVRATGAGGTSATTRSSVFVAAAKPVTTPWGRFTTDPRAYTGVPARIELELFPAGAPLTVSFDTDGDGAFDDGLFNGTDEAFTGFVADAPGVYDVRVKLTDQAGVSRVEHTTITVSDSGAGGPRFPGLYVGPARAPGQERLLEPVAEPGTTLTFDMDDDGQFDDTPSQDEYGYRWAFTAPTVLHVKATDAAGRSSARTQLVAPLAGNLGPQTSLFFQRQGFPTPDDLDDPLLLAGHTTTALYALNHLGEPCCTMRWDTDGDGDYDDATGAFPAFTAQARQYTFGARVEDSLGAFGTVRDTFSIGTRPPTAGFEADGTSVRSTATDADGRLRALEWDLDGDRDFDDATGERVSLLTGVRLVGLKASDADGDVGIAYKRVSGPPVERPRPAPTPIPATPLPAPSPAPPVAKPLVLKLTVPKVRLGALLSRGLAVRPGCERRCRATVTIAVDERTAKRLKLRSTELGRASGSGKTITVKLSAKVRKALAGARSVKLKVAILATGSDGRIGSADRVLTVKR